MYTYCISTCKIANSLKKIIFLIKTTKNNISIYLTFNNYEKKQSSFISFNSCY